MAGRRGRFSWPASRRNLRSLLFRRRWRKAEGRLVPASLYIRTEDEVNGQREASSTMMMQGSTSERIAARDDSRGLHAVGHVEDCRFENHR